MDGWFFERLRNCVNALCLNTELEILIQGQLLKFLIQQYFPARNLEIFEHVGFNKNVGFYFSQKSFKKLKK